MVQPGVRGDACPPVPARPRARRSARSLKVTASSRSPAPVPWPRTVPGTPGSPAASRASVPEALPPERSAPMPGTGMPRGRRAVRRAPCRGRARGPAAGSRARAGARRAGPVRRRPARPVRRRPRCRGRRRARRRRARRPARTRRSRASPSRRISACPGGMRCTPSYGVESCSASGDVRGRRAAPPGARSRGWPR